jgi:hypothetical protein
LIDNEEATVTSDMTVRGWMEALQYKLLINIVLIYFSQIKKIKGGGKREVKDVTLFLSKKIFSVRGTSFY